MPKWGQVAAILFGALMLWAWIGVPMGLPGIRPCIGHISITLPSPSQHYVASVQQESCLPPTEAEIIVWLRESNSQSSSSAFIANATQEINDTNYPLKVQLIWRSEFQLEVWFPRGTKLKSEARGWNGVSVVYKEVSTDAL